MKHVPFIPMLCGVAVGVIVHFVSVSVGCKITLGGDLVSATLASSLLTAQLLRKKA